MGTPAAYVTMAITFLRLKTKEIVARNRENRERAEQAATAEPEAATPTQEQAMVAAPMSQDEEKQAQASVVL